MDNEIMELPSSWAWSTPSEVCSSVRDGTHDTPKYVDNGIPLVTSKNLISGNIDFSNTKQISQEDHEEISNRSAVDSGDVLFAMIGTIGNPVVVNKTAEFSIKNIGLFKNNDAYLNSYYLKYWLDSLVFHNWLKPRLKGSTQKFAPLGLLRTLPFPIPPYNEQHRIVAKIETLFSELDKGVESLKTAREQLKIYRQALLKHAFSGNLTEQWRAENPNKLEIAEALLQRIQTERQQRYQQQLNDWETTGKQGIKPKAPKTLPPLTAEELAELPELPAGWAWARVLEACEAVVDCHNKTAPYQASGIALVRTPSIRDMKLNFDDSIRYVSKDTYEFWSKRCPPQSGDILFTREAPMGEAAIIPEGRLICMGQRIMLLRTGNVFLSAKYLLCATQNPFFKKAADKVAVGTGVKHLRVGDVERLLFPICSINEQLEIANQLDAKLSVTDQLDQTLITALQQAETLRQSILKKAFSGQLVAQDPNDEPASELLKRIQAEKAALIPLSKKGKNHA